MTELDFSRRALRDLGKLDPKIQTRVVAGIERYVETGVGDVVNVKAQRGQRLAVGDCRVFFTRPAAKVIKVDAILHRREAYRGSARRRRRKV